MGQRKAVKGKNTINYFQYHFAVGCVCMLNVWISCNDEFCADNHNYLQFKLKGKRRSAGSVTAQVQVCDSTLLRWSMSLLSSSTGAVHV